MAFPFLPSEIWDRILEFAPKATLMKARLTSRMHRESSDRSLFKTVILKNKTSSAQSVRRILASTRLKGYVSTVHIIARPTEAMAIESIIEPIETLVPEFRYALSDIYMSSHLTSFVLDFEGCQPYECAAPILQNSVMDAFRSEMFCFFIKTFTFSRHGILRSPMRALSIQNLQNRSEFHVTDSQSFISLLSQLKTLELSFLTVDHICSCPDLQSMELPTWIFYTMLPQVWLQSACQLTELRLSVDVHWGYHPKVDFRKVHLPNLQKLALHNFTFSHPWQQAWLLRHSTSLTHLVLRRCSILQEVLFSDSLDGEGYPTGPYDVQTHVPRHTYNFHTDWSDYMNTIGECLTELRYFSMIGEDEMIDIEEELTTIWRRERYLTFKYNHYSAVGDYRTYHTVDLPGGRRLLPDMSRPTPEQELAEIWQCRNDEQAMGDLLEKIRERNTHR